MPTDPSASARTPRERAALRRYAVELAVAVLLLLALLLVPIDSLVPDGGPTFRLVWALAPMVPVVGIVVVVGRYVARVDELQRRVVLEALAVGFAAAMLSALAVAFARSAGVAVGDAEWVVFVAGMLAFGAAVTVRSWMAGR